MGEKQCLIEMGSPRWKPPPQSQTKSKKSLAWLIVAAIFCPLLLLHRLLPDGHLDGCDVTGILTYVGEHIEWTSCGSIEGSDVECSSIDVPMDQFDRDRSGNKTFSIPLARLRGSINATKNIIFNPGGPGGSGVEWLYRRGRDAQKLAGGNFHILTFDPRGVNGSRPQAICYPDNEMRKSRSFALSYDALQDTPDLYPWAANFAQACADTMGEHGRYINTPQTAADMNSILDAVGQDNMVYWGVSYGTLLGQTYATLFPNRSERIIIDGVINQFEWYNDLMQPTEFEDAAHILNGFFTECVKAGFDCPLHVIAATKEHLQQNVTSFLQSLKSNPIPIYLNSTTYGTIDFKTVWLHMMLPAMYKPSSWYNVADIIAKLMKGDGTAALLTLPHDHRGSLIAEDAGFIQWNDGKSGKSFWPQQRHEVLDILLPKLEASPFAISMFDGYLVKSQWTVPRTHTYSPYRGVKTLHPLLILSTTYDPICPLSAAKVARDSFVDSRLVEVSGYGHCSTAVPSYCLVSHIRSFLNSGKLPEKDIECSVDGPYFVNPLEKEVVAAFMESETSIGHAPELCF